MNYIERRDGKGKFVGLINVDVICGVNLHPLDCTLDCTVVLLKVRVSSDFNFAFSYVMLLMGALIVRQLIETYKFAFSNFTNIEINI